MSETSDTEREALDVATRQRASQRSSKTWPTGLPAMRLHRRQQTFVPPPELRGDAGTPSAPLGPQPRLLRTKRTLTGLVLLALAWLGLFLVVSLGMAAWHVLPIQHLSFSLLLALVEVVGACWLGIAALGCLFVGAFCLMLALTRRDW